MAAKSPSIPFQRGKSKIFYQSEGVTKYSTGPSSNQMYKVSRIPSCPDGEDLTEQCVETASPRRSPSHKSQDSGFSDSGGESGSGSCNGSFYRLWKKGLDVSQSNNNVVPSCEQKYGYLEKSVSANEDLKRNLRSSDKLSKSCGDGLAGGGLPIGYHNKRLPYPQIVDTVVSSEEDDVKCGFEFKHCLELEIENKHKTMAEGGAVEEGDIVQKLCDEKGLKWHLKGSVKRFYSGLAAPLTCWLQDIRVMTEVECNNMLQNKAIAKDMSHLVAMAIRNTRDNFRALKARFQIIHMKFDKLIRKIEQNKLRHLWHDLQRLHNDVMSLMRDYNSTANPTKEGSDLKVQQTLLLESCKQLEENCKNVEKKLDNCSILEDVLKLNADFTNLMAMVLNEKIKIILDTIESPYDKFCLKVAIASLSKLALDSEDNCKLITEHGGLRSLLSICIDLKYCDLKIEALRSLATVCCIIEAIGQLAEIGGVECVTDILCDVRSSKLEKAEAAGVIAQITSPWIEHNHFIRGLSENLVNLIQSITDLAKNTTSEEEFLLAVAALANITFLDTKACFCLNTFNTPIILVDACRRRKLAESIFIKDQIATILANLVAVTDCRNSVTDCEGVVLLLCFLQVRPNMVQTQAETDACERVQQKSAIALSRLCTDEKIAKDVIRLQGVNRLVQLCKDERERNQSDAVLVACLAALRKIASSCSIDFKDAKELIEPRLLDSFLLCSSRQESFV
uniref:Protein inscuteable homologue C-terminal domain-containing protein n=1 Tax=Strigamia maritima TaxID=126957 RepID=T1J5H0_STRMM